MKQIKLALAGAGLLAAGTVALAAPAAASPSGCGTAHFVNNAPVMQYVGTQSWRVGTLTQYWGWCNSNLRNWAHMHFSGENYSFGTRVAIQTRDGALHGAHTADGPADFNSKPAATMNVDTRGYVDGNYWGGGVQTLYAQHTAWSGS